MDSVTAFYDRVRVLVDGITYRDGRHLLVAIEGTRVYLQVEAERRCVLTGAHGKGYGGKAYLSPHMVDGEIVRRAFGLFLAYEEHEVREHFKFRGRAVFGPHISVDALWTAAEQLELREAV